MKILLAVIIDLYDFAKELLGLTPLKRGQKYLPPGPESIAVTNIRRDEDTTKDTLNFNGNAGYVSVERAKVFLRPVWVADSVITTLAIGKKVELHGYQGRFARIQLTDLEGWILKDEVTTDRQQVWPKLTNKRVYEATDPVTVSVRALLDDEFFMSELFLPLQAVEYIAYRLKERNIVLSWPRIRPRVVGSWHSILKGQTDILIGLEAKTNAVMEGYMDEARPFLAYVEAVKIDGELTISSVGRLVEGQFLRETLSKEEVIKLRPVYIQPI